VQEATNVLKDAGLRLVVDQFIASPDVPANQILVQSPTAGLGARPNSVVTVNVSAGVNTVRVPDVIGDEQTAAARLLSGAPLNFVVTVVAEPSDVIEAGRVIRTEPLGDTAVAPGTAVTMYVSTGLAQVAVPDLVGKSLPAATAELTLLGLVPAVSEQIVPPGDPSDGLVVLQGVAPGTNLPLGGSVSITVARSTPSTTIAGG